MAEQDNNSQKKQPQKLPISEYIKIHELNERDKYFLNKRFGGMTMPLDKWDKIVEKALFKQPKKLT